MTCRDANNLRLYIGVYADDSHVNIAELTL